MIKQRKVLLTKPKSTASQSYTQARVFIHIVYSYRTRQVCASYVMKLDAYLFPANQISIFKTHNYAFAQIITRLYLSQWKLGSGNAYIRVYTDSMHTLSTNQKYNKIYTFDTRYLTTNHLVLEWSLPKGQIIWSLIYWRNELPFFINFKSEGTLPPSQLVVWNTVSLANPEK